MSYSCIVLSALNQIKIFFHPNIRRSSHIMRCFLKLFLIVFLLSFDAFVTDDVAVDCVMILNVKHCRIIPKVSLQKC